MGNIVERHDRLDPSGKDGYLSMQHLERYRFACGLLEPGQKVLDIACGTGYGTYILAQYGCKVLGADLDYGILEEAKKKWNYEEFQQADVLNLPFEEDLFDAVVSFETIEHVIDGKRFLSEMSRVLKPGGIFICSTPNIKYTSHPEFHVREYAPEEFYSLIDSYFIDVRRFGQYFKLKDRLHDLLHWYVRSRMVKLIEALKLKTIIMALLKKRESDKLEELENIPLNESNNSYLKDLTQSNTQSYYNVKAFNGNKRLLRIMLIVGRKVSND